MDAHVDPSARQEAQVSNKQRHTKKHVVIALSDVPRCREQANRKVKPHVRLARHTYLRLIAPGATATNLFLRRHTALFHWQRNHIVPLRRLLQQRGRVVVAVRRVSPKNIQHEHRTGEVVRSRRHTGEPPASRPLQVASCSPLLVVRGGNAQHNKVLPPAPLVHSSAWDVSQCCVVRGGGSRVAGVVGSRRVIIGSGVKPEEQNSRGRNEENQQQGNSLQLTPQLTLHRRQFRIRHGRFS
ncbi:hypothetical protein ECC02_008359 [Trypanosoma cruzi]|uniref:Uncharacterized protein n=1 Tax=Trypanosoma cruzi TaxID=5693 RepID=A0A7J6XWN9_TRYCR|nr:hypothetical protein ECC02_008359 [Trypanosoma cruzi]